MARPPLRAMIAAAGSRLSGFDTLTTQPLLTMTSSPGTPKSGDPRSASAIDINWSRACMQHARTAGDTLAADCEPPDTGALGSDESPSAKRT